MVDYNNNEDGGGGIRVIWGKYLLIADIFGVSNIERERERWGHSKLYRIGYYKIKDTLTVDDYGME